MADLSTQMPRAGADYAKNFVQFQQKRVLLEFLGKLLARRVRLP
jgi:hypothetical protein